MIYVLIILHAADAVLTWLFGRNTEYGLLFRHLTGSAWRFWSARIAFALAVAIGCELYRVNYDAGLWWFAIGFQTCVIWANFCKVKK